MLKVKLNRGNLSVSLPLVRPLMQPQSLAPTFFELVHDALVPDFPVKPAELSGGSGNKLSEVFGRFNLYGGPNSVTLYTDRLSFDFVNLIPADYPIIYDLTRRVHDAFASAFEATDFDRAEATSLIHFEAEQPGAAREYLNSFQPVRSLEPFKQIGELVWEPVARFTLVGTDQTWRCRFGVEKSLALENGIFVDLNMVLSNQSKAVPFATKLELASRIGTAARTVLELELSP
jgi:hypothetical protein